MDQNDGRRSWRLAFVAALSVVGALLGSAAAVGPVDAYSGTGAASWANAHALSTNCSQLPCDTDDCTNFISLALNLGGGYPQHIGSGNVLDDRLWFSTVNGLGGWVQSNSWNRVPDFVYYQIDAHIPGGMWYGTASGTSTAAYDGLSTGDVLIYDWDSNGTYDHAAIQVGAGTDYGYHLGLIWGNLVDAHSNSRLKVWWTLYEYNAQRNTTTIHLMNILSTN